MHEGAREIQKPLIIIPAHTETIALGDHYAIRVTYADTILAHGGSPLMVPLMTDREALESIVEVAAGLLLPGGVDVDPSLYGQEAHPMLGAVEPKLDFMERELVQAAYGRDMPILAICRGLQSLVVTLGGSLYQDLPSETSGIPHEVRQHGRSHLAHSVRLTSSSRLAGMLGSDDIPVNTFHHQGVRDVPEQLQVVGRAEDGQIEAVEDPNQTFVFGVQCHPEELWQSAEPRFGNLFARFIEASINYSRRAIH